MRGGAAEAHRAHTQVQVRVLIVISTYIHVAARFDVIMAGDVCFVKGLAEAFQAWLARVSRRKLGAVTILGDPSRREQWAPKPGWAAGMRAAATYEVRTKETSALTEGREVRNTVVWLSGDDGEISG